MQSVFSPRVLLLSFALVSPLACAQTAAQGIEELIVTANRVPVPLKQIGISITAINDADIEAHGNFSLSDILRQLPSVATSSNGGAGQTSSLRIRGEEGFRTLVIMDGMRLSDPGNTQINSEMEHILSSGIGRVEVLRGPQGLGYGADAGGIINISTRQAGAGLQGGLDAEGGSFGTQQLGMHANGGNERADFFVSAADFSTDGFNSRTDDKLLQDHDGYDNTTFHARAGINLANNWRAELVHRKVSSDTDFDGCYLSDFSYVHDCRSTYELSASRGSLRYHSDAVSHSLSYASTDTDRGNFAGSKPAFATNGKLQRWEYLGSVQDVYGLNLVFGADHENDDLEGKARTNRGYFAEVLTQFSDVWFATAGARYDDNDDFGSNTSYRLTTAWLVPLANSDQLKFKASVGTGFRAPSPYEIAYNSGAYSYPPASLVKLQQERSQGYEAGVEYWAKGGARLEAVYFDQHVENAIEFDLFSYSGYLQDPGRSASRGIELSGALPLTDALDLQANYTWNDTQRPDGSPRLRRPRQLANVGLQWQAQAKLSLRAFVRSSRAAVDQDFSGVIKLDNFAVVDLAASYQLTDTLQLFARVENALNEKYQEVIGYNTPGHAAYIGFRMSLGKL